MPDAMKYTSSLLGEQIDAALMLALSIGTNRGIPVGLGDGTIRLVAIDTSIRAGSDNIPTSDAVRRAVDRAASVATAVKYRGAVPGLADLPGGASLGDAYYVQNLSRLYVFDEEVWSDFGVIAGLLATVCGVGIDANGNVPLKAANIPTDAGPSVEEAMANLLVKPTVSGILSAVDGILRAATQSEVQALIGEGGITAPMLSPNAVFRSYRNLQVGTSEWQYDPDAESVQYPYRAAVRIADVAASDKAWVRFTLDDAGSGSFAPGSNTFDGGVYIYADEIPAMTMTIPLIVVWR